MYNETVRNFFKYHDINPDTIKQSVHCNLICLHDINPIYEEYGMYKNEMLTRVSIGDIVGYNYDFYAKTLDVFSSLNLFFDEKGDGYHNRSCHHLRWSPEEMLASSSLSSEPMVLNNVDPDIGLYTVATNGLHRFSVLRVLYLNEVFKHPQNEQQIKKKYTIEVISRNIDKIKTYCNFIVTTSKGSLRNEFDQSYNITGRTILTLNGIEKTISDDELLKIAKSLFKKNKEAFEPYYHIIGFKNFVMEFLYTNSMDDLGGKYEL